MSRIRLASKWSCLVLVVLIALMTLVPFEGVTSVSGRVEDARLTPISGATVTLSKGNSGTSVDKILTDENGNYSIKITHPLENFMLDLTVSKAGYETQSDQIPSSIFKKENLVTLEKSYANPIQGFFNAIGDGIVRGILLSFTENEWKFIKSHPQYSVSQELNPADDENERVRKLSKVFCEWIAGDQGEVDASFPMLQQVVSITHFNRPEIPEQLFLEYPTKQGSLNRFSWTRVEKQDETERIVITGVFHIKTHQGKQGRARALRVVELQRETWKTVKQEFHWIPKLPGHQKGV